ncbi:MAG: hypothetical protein ABJC19_03540 [Gemmatimonadota bacterium]
MTTPVAHPFDLVFGALAEERFPAIRAALPAQAELDEFMLTQPAVELLRELRPDEGLGEGVDEFVAFVHAAFRYWEDGQHSMVLDDEQTRALCRPDAAPGSPPARLTAAYIQMAPRRIWGRLDDGDVFEPLDGWFAVPVAGGVRVVACFGVHPNRPGLSLLVVEGGRPGVVCREDGSALFAPLMPGGDTAGLHAVVAPEELLLLAWRADARMEA